MASPVIVEWIVKGIPDIVRASRTVQDTVLAAERNATRSAQQQAAARARIVQQEAAQKIRILQKVDNDTRRIQENAAKGAQRAADQEVRAAQRAGQEKIRIAERTSAAVERAQARSIAHQNRVQEQQARQEYATRRQFVSAIAGSAARGVATGAGRVAGIAGQVGGMVTQLGGGFSIADSVQRGVSLRHDAAVLSASTELAGSGAQKFSTNDVLSKARSIGAQQGIDPAEVLKGFDEIKKLSGDLGKAMEVMPDIAKLATATGGKLSEMSGLAANIVAANPNISRKDLDSQMRVFTRQGVVGGVEVADFAKYGSRLTAGATFFGGNKEKNEATLGAMAQMSRQYGGAASPAEATLGSQRFATDVAKHAKGLKKSGIDVSDGHGNLKDAQEILLEMLQKTKGDVTKLGEMGLGERGVKPLLGVSALYKNAGGGDAGMKAVKDEFAKYTSGVSSKEVDAANSRVLSEADAKMEQIRQKFDQAVSEKIIPKLLELMPVLEKLIPDFVTLSATALPAFVDLIKSIGDFADANKGLISDIAAHPIGAIMAFEVSKSIVGAALGDVFKKAIASALGGAGGGAGVPGGGPGKGGVGAAIGAGALAGALTYAAVKPGVDGALEGQTEGQASAGALTSSLKRGSAREKAAALAQYETMRKRSGGVSGAYDVIGGGIAAGAMSIYSGITGEKNTAAANLKQTAADREVLANDDLKALVQAIQNNTKALGSNGAAPTAPNAANRGATIVQRSNQ